MANLTIERIDSKDPAKQGNLSQNLQDSLASAQLKTWAETADFADDLSIEEVFELARALPDLDEEAQANLADWDGYIQGNIAANGNEGGTGDNGGDTEFDLSKKFDENGSSEDKKEDTPKKKTERKRLSPEEQNALLEEHRREVANLESERSADETKFIENLKGFLAPYNYLPILLPVTRNNGRLSAKLVNKIPASKRTFAIGVPEEIKATVDKNNIPAHYATAEYDITFFESNPGPLLGVLAYLPRNFDPSVLESLSTAQSRAKVDGWISATSEAKAVTLRWVSKEELLNIMVATAFTAVLVDEGKPDTKSNKNLEFFYKRMHDTETGNTWYNLISRDSGLGKARKGTSAGYIPLNTFIQESETHALLLQEAQKRRAKTSQSSMLEQKNTMQATNELLRGQLPQLGKKTKK